ncbi:hypothetical protein [Bradyrhizobium vignae]|nr:hypothetical protein [Bradyrhizobium vignae]
MRELVSWIRFNEAEALARALGLFRSTIFLENCFTLFRIML